MHDERDERSLGQLFGDLSRQLGTLVQQEIALARTEMTARASEVGRDATMLGLGAALAYAALLVGLVGVALLIVDLGLAPWLSFLVVAAVAAVIAGVLIQRGREQLSRTELAPRQTIQTVKEDAAWIKQRAK